MKTLAMFGRVVIHLMFLTSIFIVIGTAGYEDAMNAQGAATSNEEFVFKMGLAVLLMLPKVALDEAKER